MFRRPAQRLTTACFVVLALLFSQLALANYMCPAAPADAEVAAMEMVPGMPCEEMDAQMDENQPVLCHQHCANPAQSFEPLSTPGVSLPAIVQVLVVPLVQDGASAESRIFADLGRGRPPPEPLFLSTLRLRV